VPMWMSAAVKAFIAANAAGDEELKRDIQAERSRIEQQLQIAQGYRNTLEVTERDLDEFMRRVEWVMEHPNCLGFSSWISHQW